MWPVRQLLDSRFADVNRRLASVSQETREALDSTSSELDQLVSGYASSTVETVTFIGSQLREFEDRIAAALQEVRAEAAQFTHDYVEEELRGRLVRTAEVGLAALDRPLADLVNYAFGHTGFAAQAELWMNTPIVLNHGPGEVTLASVNERIVEVPFALRALSAVEPGARVLDFGSSESSLALSLASLGYAVTALDVRTYPFEHPNLAVAAVSVDAWQPPAEPYDAALCVSTVEHVGLGWYGDPKLGADGDRRSLEIVDGALRPGGLLVLTVPYGVAEQDELERRYDGARLDALLDGWEVFERRIVECAGDTTWLPVEDSTGHAVALVAARKPSP